MSKGLTKKSFTKVNYLAEELIKDTSLSAAMVYYMIKRYKINSDDPHCCYPSIDDLMDNCNLKKRQLENHFKTLENAGWLVIKSGGTVLGKNNNYYFPKEIDMYTDSELNYISKIERRSTKKDNTVEEVPINPSLDGECFDFKEFTYNDLTDAQKKMVDVGLSTVEQYSKSKEELFTEEMGNYNNSMIGISEDELNILDERASYNLASNKKFKPVGKYVDEVEEYDPLDGMFEEDIIIPKISEDEKIKKQCDDLVTSMNHNRNYVENGITYGVDKNGFSYRLDEVKFDFVPTKPKIRKNSIKDDDFLNSLEN